MAGIRKILVLYTSGVFDMRDLGKGFEAIQNPLDATLRSNALFHDANCASVADKTLLVLPQVRPVITYRVLQYDSIIDSSDMSIEMYVRIALDVHRNYQEYDGFIILHGTDTLAYTAAALSFICENLGKPILLTGSQLPLRHLHSDARNNLLGLWPLIFYRFTEALEVAGHYTIPEVAVLFDHNVFRGNRVCKTNSMAFHAFQSPNLPPLVSLGVGIDIDWPIVLKPTELKPFSVCTQLSSHVTILRLFPALSHSTIAAFVAPPIEGVVLMTYGTGVISHVRSEVLAVLRAAVHRSVIIVNVTQCLKGAVKSTDLDNVLNSIGVCPGHDMTAEAAVAKLMYVCAKPWPLEQKLRAMQRSLRGELTVRGGSGRPTGARQHLEALSDILGLHSIDKAETVQRDLLPMLMAAAIKEDNTTVLMQLGGLIGHYQISDHTGRTPLHHAAHFGSVTCTELLLHNGALVNQTDSEGRTPLQVAAERGFSGVIRLLRDTGAHLPTSNHHELGSRLCALAAAANADGVCSLVEAGADVNASDYDGRRALHLAVRRGNTEVVRRLIVCGADPTLRDAFGRTPLDELEAVTDEEASEDIKHVLHSF